MTRIKLNRDHAAFETAAISFILAIMVFTAIMIGFLPVVSEQPQTYTDIIYANLSDSGMNKSGEMRLFWIAFTIAAILQSVLYYVIASHSSLTGSRQEIHIRWIGCIQQHLRRMRDSRPVTALWENRWRVILLGIFSYYTVTGVTLLFVRLFSGLFTIHTGALYIWSAAALITLGLVFMWKLSGRVFVDRAICVLQVFAPLNLLVFINDRYLFLGDTLIIRQSPGYYVIVFGLMTALYIVYFAGRQRNKSLKDLAPSDPVISLASVIAIFVFNSYFLPARIIPDDIWHTGEQILAWQQAVERGAVLYRDYNPPSGLHPMVLGFILDVILDGKASSYCAAVSLMMIIFATLTIVLFFFCSHSKRLTLILAALFGLTIYNRFYCLLPSLLLLLLPKLIKNRNGWLRAWILCCLAGGLYYPLYGVALLVGTFPFAVVQAVMLVKSGELKSRIKNPGFWAGWCVVILPVLLCAPLLFRMAKYFISSSSQSLMADGMTWLGYDDGILSLAMRISLPVVFVLFALLCIQIYLVDSSRTILDKLTAPAFLGFSSVPLVLAVSYTYTLMRPDPSVMLSRTAGILIPIGTMLFAMLLNNYGKSFMQSKVSRAMIIFLLPVGFLLILFSGWIIELPNAATSDVGTGGFRYDASKITDCNVVTDKFTLMTEENTSLLPRAGSGFMEEKQFALLGEYARTIKKYGIADVPFVNVGRMYYYILNLRVPESDATILVLSDEGQNDLIAAYNEELPVVGLIASFNNYPIYRWMIEHHYVSMETGLYMPYQMVEDLGLQDYVIYNGLYKNLVEWGYTSTIFSNSVNCRRWGMNANALGRSYDSLKWMFGRRLDLTGQVSASGGTVGKDGVFTVIDYTDASVHIQFDDLIRGTDYDYLYLNIETSVPCSKQYDGSMFANLNTYFNVNEQMMAYSVELYWCGEDGKFRDDKMFRVYLGDGKLLIPLGCLPNWLLMDNAQFKIVFPQNFPVGESFEIKEAELLQRNLKYK